MSHGYIYVLSNDAMPGLTKVGKTTNTPDVRAGQLSTATGVPEKFSLHKQYEVVDCDEAERHAHQVLELVLGRPNTNREFFAGEAVHVAGILDEALASRMVRQDGFSISIFQEAINKLINKEFTFARLELEALFREIDISEEKIRHSNALTLAAAAYVACCYIKNTAPYHPCFFAPNVKGVITEKVIEYAKLVELDPIDGVIKFLRAHN